MKKYLLLILTFVIFVGCDESSDTKIAKQTEKAMAEANRQIGMPAIKNFQERKLMKMILELRDKEDLICYCYIITITGKKIFLGKCIGFGLPYSVQYTNPQKLAILSPIHPDGSTGTNLARIVPQQDPNGLFMPEGLSATWVMLINPKTNKPHPVYIENEIIVSPFPLN
jgi:hypothetical protein